ncbi:MAG: PD-(D/E)XK nuclease family transposase [Synergistaceae bacterium]|nr:PD-(D/E)XK nuclease family transposase [Synergistaceae bacterium]
MTNNLIKHETTPEEYEAAREEILNSCLMDDMYMRQFFDNNIECTQLVLRVIMQQDDLIVESVEVQKYMPGAEESKRAVQIDVYAVDSEGRHYDIEIQRDNSGAAPERARFCSAMLDVRMLEKKQDFKDIKNSIVIFITERDVLGRGLQLYKIERYINGENLFNDGSKIIYANTSHKDDTTALGKLLHDFLCVNADEMYYEELASRTRFFKGDLKGDSYMKSVWDEMEKRQYADGFEGGKEFMIINMLKAGKLAFDEIAEYSKVPLAKIKKIAESLA